MSLSRHEGPWYADKTAYPKLYESVYWGRFTHNDTDKSRYGIYENRNRFVEQFKIERVVPRRVFDRFVSIASERGLTFPKLDHVEAYQNKDGVYIFVASFWSSPETVERMLSCGWTVYHKLYATNQVTYITAYTFR